MAKDDMRYEKNDSMMTLDVLEIKTKICMGLDKINFEAILVQIST